MQNQTKNLSSVVHNVINKRKTSRSSNFKLYHYVAKDLGYDLDTISGTEMLNMMNKGKLPNFDTVARMGRAVKSEKGVN